MKTKRSYRRKSKSTVAKLAKDVRTLKKQNPENPKYGYVAWTSNNLSTSITGSTPVIESLADLPTGLNEVNNRVGDQCRWVDVDIPIHLRRTSSVADIPYNVRVLLVREYTTLGSNISLNQLFNSLTPSVYDVFNHETRDARRFQVLYDKTISIGPMVVSTTATQHFNPGPSSCVSLRIKRKLNIVTDYSRDVTGTVTDIEKNGFFLIVISDCPTSGDLKASYSFMGKYYNN